MPGFFSTLLWVVWVRSPFCMTTWGCSSPLQSWGIQPTARETRWGYWLRCSDSFSFLCSVDYTIQLWCGIIFNVWKGCHYHHHWIAGKPQGETLQLPGPVEQGTWKVIFLTKLIWFVSCVKIFSLTYTYLLIIMRRRITQTKIIQLYYYFIRRWVVYQPGPDSCDSFSASHLQQFLSSFLESQRGPGGKPHLLVLSPG